MKTFLYAIVAMMTMATTAMAGGMYEVSRTSTLEAGIFVPALAVLVAGERHILKLGENGLTRSIVFDADKAKAFAEANVALPAGVVLQVALRGGGAVDAFGVETSGNGPIW